MYHPWTSKLQSLNMRPTIQTLTLLLCVAQLGEVVGQETREEQISKFRNETGPGFLVELIQTSGEDCFCRIPVTTLAPNTTTMAPSTTAKPTTPPGGSPTTPRGGSPTTLQGGSPTKGGSPTPRPNAPVGGAVESNPNGASPTPRPNAPVANFANGAEVGAPQGSEVTPTKGS